MHTVTVTDCTISSSSSSHTFREKLEAVRSLDRMAVDYVEFAPLTGDRSEPLLLRTAAAAMTSARVSLRCGDTEEEIDRAWDAVSGVSGARLAVALPTAAAQMEYLAHVKPKDLPALTERLVARAVSHTKNVEFLALDATRSDYGFLIGILRTAVAAGASTVTVCDSASLLLPDEAAELVTRLRADLGAESGIRLGIECGDGLGMGLACAASAMKAGADEIRCASVGGQFPTEEGIGEFLRARGDSLGICAVLRVPEMNRLTSQIRWILGGERVQESISTPNPAAVHDQITALDNYATASDVTAAARRLGYDLNEEDQAKVFEAFKRIARKKPVSARELEVIVATSALQVPPTYTLLSYSAESNSAMPASAQIHLEKNGEELSGISLGDGPIDAAFQTLERLIGHHYELDEFRIEAVTEGQEAMASTLVRLRSDDGKLYLGNGISTDLISAAIRAYLNAVNKIVYEEA